MDARKIVSGMLDGREDWQRLYVTSAYFKYGLDHFAQQVLPLFVSGLAVAARDQDADMAERIEKLMHLPAFGHSLTARVSDDFGGEDT